MKRSILFWPLVFGAVVFVVWIGFCFFVVGLVIGVPTSGAAVAPRFTVPTFWSPAANVLNVRQSGTLAGLLASAVNGLWGVAPYSRAPRREAEAGSAEEQVEMLILRHYHHRGAGGGLQQGHMVVVVPKGGWTTYLASIISVWPEDWTSLSAGQVLLYVFLIPGVHFTLLAFIVVVLIAFVVRALMRFIPDGAPPPGEEGGEHP